MPSFYLPLFSFYLPVNNQIWNNSIQLIKSDKLEDEKTSMGMSLPIVKQ